MRRIHDRKIGMPPGTLKYTGGIEGGTSIELIEFDHGHFKQTVLERLEDLKPSGRVQ